MWELEKGGRGLGETVWGQMVGGLWEVSQDEAGPSTSCLSPQTSTCSWGQRKAFSS